MSWEKRALGILLAGGAISLGACTTSSTSPVPCGNANPDPCICGRQDESAAAAERCRVYSACSAAGGAYSPGTQEPDGAPAASPSCTLGDASAGSDAGDASPGENAGDASDDGPG